MEDQCSRHHGRVWLVLLPLLFVLLMPVVFTAPVHATPPAAAWITEVIDPDTPFGNSVDLVLDTRAMPHVAYGRAPSPLDYQVRYVQKVDGTWVASGIEEIALNGAVRLAIDSQGQPHAGYTTCDPFGCALRYSRWTGTDWVAEGLDTSVSGVSLSLALDANNLPHLTYCKQDLQTLALELHYTFWTGTGWSNQIVDSCWYNSSLALDASGRPHISFHRTPTLDIGQFPPTELVYTTWDGSEWATQVVEAGNSAGYEGSLALDTQGRPHIAYKSGSWLRYASLTDGSWQLQTASSVTGSGPSAQTSLRLDTRDNPYIAYEDNQAVMLARRLDVSWEVERVADGSGAVLALDPSDRPHLSYFGGAQGWELIYAYEDPGPTAVTIAGLSVKRALRTTALPYLLLTGVGLISLLATSRTT
jgi:hypothetical protein